MVLQSERDQTIARPVESDDTEPVTDTTEPLDPVNGPRVISARKVRSGGLGFENRKEGLSFAIAAGGALCALILVAVVTSITA